MSQQINLLNPIFRKQRHASSSVTMMAASIGLIVVLTALYGVYETTHLSQVEAQARAVEKTLADARAQHELAKAPASKPDAALEVRLRELTAEVKARQDVLEALKRGTVGATGGFSEYLRAFSRQRVEGVWLTGFDISAGGAELTIVGRALNADLVPTYLQRLNHEPPMQGRRFASVAINRPAPKDPPKAADAKGVQTASSLPPYLDFKIASEPSRDAPRADKAEDALASRGLVDAETRIDKAKSWQ